MKMMICRSRMVINVLLMIIRLCNDHGNESINDDAYANAWIIVEPWKSIFSIKREFGRCKTQIQVE